MTHTKIEGKFYALQNDEWLLAWSELKPAEVQVLYYLRTLDPFGDKEIELGVTQLGKLLRLAKSTVSKALKALSQLGWIDLELIKVKVKLRSRSCSPESTSLTTGNSVSYSEPQFPTRNSSFPESTPVSHSEQPQAEIKSPQVFQSSKTLQTFKTTHTGAVEKFSEEAAPTEPAPQVKNPVPTEPAPKDVTTSGSSFTHISNTLPSPQKPQQGTNSAPTEKDSQIPQDLRNKLQELEIPLDGRVRKALASHDLSQAYGAVAHVEDTWETINNPRGVFLFQISRQPVEPMGARLPVKTAADDLTLEYLKRMYPNTWQDAAAHFGLEVDV